MNAKLRRCTALAVLSELDWEVLRAVPQPTVIKELDPWLRCELSHRHRGQHHALAQGDAKRRDWWLRWTDDATIRDRDLAILLPCAADAANEASAETDPCLLFAGHAGPHSFQIDRHDLQPYTKPPLVRAVRPVQPLRWRVFSPCIGSRSPWPTTCASWARWSRCAEPARRRIVA